MSPINKAREMNFVTNHVAALIVLAAIAFLLCVEKGFRGLKLEIS